jgi:hypothetical protein
MIRIREQRLAAAEASGGLIRHIVALERGEHDVRRLWLTPDVVKLLEPGFLDEGQRQMVKAALRRFVIGGIYAVVTRKCQYPQAVSIGDIRELKVRGPIFVEVRFKPPKHHLRVFGRFIGKDDLILTSAAEKSSQKQLKVPDENKLCTAFFNSHQLDLNWVPRTIQLSISNAKFA